MNCPISHKPASIERNPKEHRGAQPRIQQTQMEAVRNGKHVHKSRHWDSSNKSPEICKLIWFYGWLWRMKQSHPNQFRCANCGVGKNR